MKTTPELLCLSLVSRLSKKGPPSPPEFITTSLKFDTAPQCGGFGVVLKRSESLLSVSLDAFWVVPILIILKFPDGRLFSSSVLNTWVLSLFPGSVQTAGLALTYGGFCILCSAQSSYLSSSPDTAGNLSERAGPSFLFSCLCEFIFYSSSAIFMRLEERSAIHACIQPGMFKGKTR